MAVSTSVHSNAFNFMSFLSNGVDPRTGQYTVSINLPEVKANGLIGPELPLCLTYNPLNTRDSGFGLGWNLQLSQFDPASQVVSLASGESLKVTSRAPGSDRLLMQEQKIDNFHLHSLGGGQYRLAHKAGLVEWLREQGTGRVALPERVQAASGHAITLGYSVFGGWPVLASVSDAAGQPLLSITRSSTAVEILLNPGAGPGGEALARFVMHLEGSDSRVARISLPTDNLAAWRFSYRQVRDLLCISSVHTPTGAREELLYQDSGHQFPASSGRLALPRVTRHTTYPGFDQPAVDVVYTYDPQEHNFLGAGLGITWADDGLDNLYQYIGPYTYQSSEALFVDGQPRRSITRTFNRFHLLTEETTTQGTAQQRVETRYPLTDDVPFLQQPRQCQLPVEVTTSWTRTDDSSRLRSETVTSAYDDYGNLVREQQASGIVETSTWYPAGGAGEDCPADPEGFVRWLKDKTVTPAVADGEAPALRTLYRYLALPALDDSELPAWLATRSETLQPVDGASPELQRTTYEYIDAPGNAFLHGRLERETRRMNGLDTLTVSQYSQQDNPVFGQSVLHTRQTLTGYDGEEKIIDLEDSLLTGEPLLLRDDNDVEIRYRYDSLRRVLEETVAPGTPWQAARQYAYRLCANDGEQAWQSRVDVKQVRTTSRFDGLGRVVFEERDDPDNGGSGRPRQIYAARHDAWGNLAEETEYDWLEQQSLALTRRYEYDDWNQPLAVTGPDGVRTLEQTDPIGTGASAGPLRCSWREGGGRVSGTTQTQLNLFDEPARTERLDRQGQSISLTLYQYDGLGRCLQERTEVDGTPRTSGSRYDAFDRVLDSLLADGAVVHRRYAAHSSEDLPEAISVEAGGSDTLLGEQTFDGLDRRIRRVSGGRVQHFSYDPGFYQPGSMTTASGQTVEYEYRPELGSDPLQRRLPGSVQARYDYDAQNALLLHCDEQGEVLEREYFSTRELKREIRRSADGSEHSMDYRYSRLGRLLGYTDVLGQQQSHEYDASGRLQETRLGSTRARLEYDALGRLASTVTHDDSSGQHLGIRLEYDDFDREILRVFDLDGTAQTLEQHWNEDDQLIQRVLTQGSEVLRDERYEYDSRARLRRYLCSGSLAPVDPCGKTIDEQSFAFDALDNITLVITRFAEGINRARYFYDGQDPVQLQRIENSHADYPPLVSLAYDADGNLVRDEASRTLAYDALNRLLSVSGPSGSHYRYDPLDTLAGQGRDPGNASSSDQRFYQAGQLVTRLEGEQARSWLRGDGALLAEAGQALLATDGDNTVLGKQNDKGRMDVGYSAYGYPYPPSEGGPAFKGEYAEPAIGWQLLGNGYRVYSPVLMRFHSPDSLSPFDAGGVNAYAYCTGDPVNEVDPTGHLRVWKLIANKRLLQWKAPSQRTPSGTLFTKAQQARAGRGGAQAQSQALAQAAPGGLEKTPVRAMAEPGPILARSSTRAASVSDAGRAAASRAAAAGPGPTPRRVVRPAQTQAAQAPRQAVGATRGARGLNAETRAQIQALTEQKNAARTNVESERIEAKIRQLRGW